MRNAAASLFVLAATVAPVAALTAFPLSPQPQLRAGFLPVGAFDDAVNCVAKGKVSCPLNVAGPAAQPAGFAVLVKRVMTRGTPIAFGNVLGLSLSEPKDPLKSSQRDYATVMGSLDSEGRFVPDHLSFVSETWTPEGKALRVKQWIINTRLDGAPISLPVRGELLLEESTVLESKSVPYTADEAVNKLRSLVELFSADET